MLESRDLLSDHECVFPYDLPSCLICSRAPSPLTEVRRIFQGIGEVVQETYLGILAIPGMKSLIEDARRYEERQLYDTHVKRCPESDAR